MKTTYTSWEQLKTAFEKADSSPVWIRGELDKVPFETPEENLEYRIENIGSTTPQQRKELVEKMEKEGWRCPTLSELMVWGIENTGTLKKKKYIWFNTLKEYSLGGFVQTSCLRWYGVRREVSAGEVRSGWYERVRFLFVRKALGSSPSASALEPLTLESAIEICKKNGLTVTKIY